MYVTWIKRRTFACLAALSLAPPVFGIPVTATFSGTIDSVMDSSGALSPYGISAGTSVFQGTLSYDTNWGGPVAPGPAYRGYSNFNTADPPPTESFLTVTIDSKWTLSSGPYVQISVANDYHLGMTPSDSLEVRTLPTPLYPGAYPGAYPFPSLGPPYSPLWDVSFFFKDSSSTAFTDASLPLVLSSQSFDYSRFSLFSALATPFGPGYGEDTYYALHGTITSLQVVSGTPEPEPTLQELASFAWNPYELGNDTPPIGSAVPSGFTKIAEDFGDDDAYHTAAYKRGDDIVIAFEGTFFPDLRDWMVNYGYGSGVPNPRVVEYVGEAAKFVAEVASVPENEGANIQLVGHSLGGGIAQLIGDASGYKTTTFNSAGAAFLVEAVDELLAPVRGLSQVDYDIMHYRIEGDPVSLLTDQIQPENIVTIQSPSGPISVMPHELVNLGYYHSIETVWVALGADLPRVNGVPDSNILASIALIVNPVLSAVDGTKEFMSWVATFGDPYYFDPPHAYGYVFDRGTGPLFTSVLLPARDDGGLYEFFLPKGGDWVLSGLLNGFDWYTFDEPLARFAIGNMPTYGPTLSGSVFGLTFASTGTFDGTMSPVDRQRLVPAVPEPGSLILLGLGMGGMGLVRLTRRRTH